ncbi:bacteriohemerythrin [Dongshaea marina]|uniref:bacteriohemerythrin n=1 Tax=Dongshaea marina TaxID=2047966 RepID=UPI000D3EBF78|nr:bacteriohemerythrin [Dongshaea marina]
MDSDSKTCLTLNIPIVDRQHQWLFELIEELGQMKPSGTSKRKVAIILSKLLDYSHYHFETEEKLFRLNEYPVAEEHLEDHEHFVFTFNKLRKEFDKAEDNQPETEAELIIKIHRYLLRWWTHHILEKDSQYVDFIKNTEI